MQLQGVRENMEVAVTLRLLAHSVASAPAVRLRRALPAHG